MINDAALTPGRGWRASDVTLGSCWVRGGRGHELNMKLQGGVVEGQYCPPLI